MRLGAAGLRSIPLTKATAYWPLRYGSSPGHSMFLPLVVGFPEQRTQCYRMRLGSGQLFKQKIGRSPSGLTSKIDDWRPEGREGIALIHEGSRFPTNLRPGLVPQ